MLGAGEGNRTLVCSLGSCPSTTELRPRSSNRITRIWGGENRHRKRCAVAPRLIYARDHPTTTFVLGRICALPAVTEMAPIRISMRDLQAFATEETTR